MYQSEGNILIDIMNDHGLEQLVHFPTREKHIGFNIHFSPWSVSGSMRKDALEFAKEKYFNGHSNIRSVQENFDLMTSFIQDSADKHIPSKTSRSVSSVPWITPEIRRKIRRKNKTHAKAKKDRQ